MWIVFPGLIVSRRILKKLAVEGEDHGSRILIKDQEGCGSQVGSHW